MSSRVFGPDRIIGVVGAGSMGAGIALVAARAGHSVRLHDLDPAAAHSALRKLSDTLDREVERGRLTQERRAEALRHIQVAEPLADLADCDLVIEAIVERLDVKIALFQALEDIVSTDAILATNTSSLSITSIGASLRDPHRFLGMHFFNPAQVLPLVEVVSGALTDPQAAVTIVALASAWGKTPVQCGSTPGFIVNRVARPFYGEALKLLEERAARPETVDAALTECGGFRMGPCALMDLIGHDVNYSVTRSIFDAYFCDPRYSPSLIQQDLVSAGRLGRKTGSGFFDYGPNAAKPSPPFEPRSDVRTIVVDGTPGRLAPLVEAAHAEGLVELGRGACRSGLKINGVLVLLTDGRTAADHAAACGDPVILVDLALDYASADRIVVAASPGADLAPFVALAQCSGKTVTRIEDVPGLIVARTVCMLANEAADALGQGVASATDIDLAMTAGVNYPIGPLAWADRVGIAWVVALLDNLDNAYRNGRYRAAPLMRRHALSAIPFLPRVI